MRKTVGVVSRGAAGSKIPRERRGFAAIVIRGSVKSDSMPEDLGHNGHRMCRHRNHQRKFLIQGKGALRKFWKAALARIKSLHFVLEAYLWDQQEPRLPLSIVRTPTVASRPASS